MKKELNDIVIYQAEDGQMSFNVNVFDETVWLTQKQMADLFDKSKTINEHVNNCFEEGEVSKNATIRSSTRRRQRSFKKYRTL